MTYCFDIDGTLCHGGEFPWYVDAEPDERMCDIVRQLKSDGHRIVIWTARGSSWPVTDRLREMTLGQLKLWDVPFDELRFGKPVADLYIDDRGRWAEDFKTDWGIG